MNWRRNSDELWRPAKQMIDHPVKRLVNLSFLVLSRNHLAGNTHFVASYIVFLRLNIGNFVVFVVMVWLIIV